MIGVLLLVVLVQYCRLLLACPDPCSCFHGRNGTVTTVDCSHRNLTSVPDNIPKSVITLNLGSNNISFLNNGSFNDLSGLVDLNLSSNSLERLQVDAFKGAGTLEILSLAGNNLIMDNNSYPREVFRDLRNLRILRLNDNVKDETAALSTTFPDWALQDLVSLEELYIDGLWNTTLGGGFRNLTRLQRLDFEGNQGYCNIQYIQRNMFANITTKRPLILNLTHCELREIDSLAFKALPTLEVLDMFRNRHLGFSQFMMGSQGLQFTNVKVLNITTIHAGSHMILKREHFQHMSKTNLTHLKIDYNDIICVKMLAVTGLPRSLKHLSIRNNKLQDAQFLIAVALMPNLEVFDMGFQLQNTKSSIRTPLLGVKDEYCARKQSQKLVHYSEHRNESVLKYRNGIGIRDTVGEPALHGTLNRFVIDHDFPDTCNLESHINITVVPLPPKLHTLIADHIGFSLYTIPKLNFTSKNVLRTISVSTDYLSCWGGPILHLRDLQVLDLSSNRCDDVSPFFFEDFPNLTHLYLQDNDLGNPLWMDKTGRTFAAQSKLQDLSLRKNWIRELPSKIFKNLFNLKRLDLSVNSLSYLGTRISHMRRLSFLNLSTNQFTSLDNDLRWDLDVIADSNDITVAMSGNRLHCDCDSLPFVQWLFKTRVEFVDFENLTCETKSGSIVNFVQLEAMLDDLWFQCNALNVFIIVLVCFVLLLSLMGMSSAIYYKRWQLRYLFYISRRRVNPYSRFAARGDGDCPCRDVFISYDDENIQLRQLLQSTFLQRLDAQNVSYLVSETYFLCGRNNHELIDEALLKTKKTLALLTKDFFSIYERLLEFTMAVMLGMETRQDLVIPIKIEELNRKDLPPEVITFLDVCPPLEYQDNADFWNELVTRIKADPH